MPRLCEQRHLVVSETKSLQGFSCEGGVRDNTNNNRFGCLVWEHGEIKNVIQSNR